MTSSYDSISKVHIKTFDTNLRHLAQQSASRLRACVTEKSEGTSNHAFPRLSSTSFVTKTAAALTTTPAASGLVWSNRCAIPATYHQAETVVKEDAAKMLLDPQSNILKAFAMAARRNEDQIIINALESSAAKDEAGGSNDVPAAQKLTLSGGFDLAAVSQIYEKFLYNNIDPDEEKFLVVSPWAVRKLQNITAATSEDFVNVKALATNGMVSKWMGFTWIVSNLCTLVSGTIGTGSWVRNYSAFTRRACGLLVVNDLWSTAGQDPSNSFDVRVYAAHTLGAVRIEDEHYVQCAVTES